MAKNESIKSILREIDGKLDRSRNGRKSPKKPSMQWYPGDWRKDPGIQSMDYEHRGIWFEILMIMHESGQRGRLVLNGKAMPDEALACLLGLSIEKTQNSIKKFIDYGVVSRDSKTNILFNRRMIRDEKVSHLRRLSGSLGGNPALLTSENRESASDRKINEIDDLLNHKVTTMLTTQVNQNLTPSSSSSSSSSTSVKEENKDTPPTPSHKITTTEIFELWEKERGPLEPVRAPKPERLGELVDYLNSLVGQESVLAWVEIIHKTRKCHKSHRPFMSPYFFAKDTTHIDQVMNGLYEKSFERGKYGSTKVERAGRGDAEDFGVKGGRRRRVDTLDDPEVSEV